MVEEVLRRVLESGVFAEKRVCIDEVLPQNATFLIIDISSMLGLPIFAFNETAEHYSTIACKHNKKIVARSIYNGEYVPSDIIDDVWTAANVYGTNTDARFSVYRANSCMKSNWYGYDIVVRIEPLESGTSAEIDGKISIFDRHRKYHEIKYKVLRDRTVYYS